MAMDGRKLVLALGTLLIAVAAVFGLSLTRNETSAERATKAEAAAKAEERLEDACASSATYSRLKEVAFEEAVRIRNADPANLDTLAASSVVRMENPVVKSRDEDLNVTVCSGRFVLELPPGAEAAFGGERRLIADIEYAAQAAADGSGLVYQIKGAEPIVYKLAAFDLRGQRLPVPAPVQTETQVSDSEVPDPQSGTGALPAAPTREVVPLAPQTAPSPRLEPALPVEPAPSAARANPSFNCRLARTRGERMVCSSNGLAASDRAMSSLFYSALANADSGTRRALRRTRDAFLAYRDRCPDEACVRQAYEGRMEEIRDIMADAQ